MGRKLMGLLVVGVVIALALPVGGVPLQTTDEKTPAMNINQPASQLEVRLWGGLGLHALIKNTGTTDIIGANITLIFDGPGILWGTQENTTKFDIAAGKTKLAIFPVYGFGATNIKFIVDTTTQTASAKVLFYFVFRVK
jgi:hypothetical protein